MHDKNDEMLRAFREFVRAQRQLAQVLQRNLVRMAGVREAANRGVSLGGFEPPLAYVL